MSYYGNSVARWMDKLPDWLVLVSVVVFICCGGFGLMALIFHLSPLWQDMRVGVLYQIDETSQPWECGRQTMFGTPDPEEDEYELIKMPSGCMDTCVEGAQFVRLDYESGSGCGGNPAGCAWFVTAEEAAETPALSPPPGEDAEGEEERTRHLYIPFRVR